MKLFEIPVYALSKEVLAERVENRIRSFRDRYPDFDFSKNKQILDLDMYPQRLWHYNHIIGYIAIVKTAQDISINWYSSVPSIKRYHWYSRHKHFIQNTYLNGYHLYLGDIKTGDQLRRGIKELVNGFVMDLKKSGYYVDLETFNNIDMLIDYDRLLQK